VIDDAWKTAAEKATSFFKVVCGSWACYSVYLYQ